MPFEPRLVASASELDALPRAPVDASKVEQAVRILLEGIGEDPARPGLAETPRRVAESFAEMLSGYATDPVAVLEPLPDERVDGLVMVRAIRLVGLCEHHLLPFTGSAAVAYMPRERFTGLSKLARVVEVLSRRLQVQERLTREIADAIEGALDPHGVWVLVEAEHLCMGVRGARAPGSITVTTEARGIFADDASARAELLALARGEST